MKNKFIDMMQSRVLIKITGKNPERFILRLHKNKIDIIDLKKINEEQIEIIINYKDYEKMLKLNTIYHISIIKYQGIEKKKRQFFKYYHVLIMILLCIIMVYILSKVIFDVQIVTNDEQLKQRLSKTLETYEISKYHFQKDYRYLQKVKTDILKKYHDEIEWIEIEKVGTKYVIRYEPRVVKNQQKKTNYRHVIAKKNAIIESVFASSGQIVKNKYSYVKKGDIIISGYIHTNDKIKKTVAAKGKVYGEVWYITKVTYPFNYYEEKKTGKSKTVYSVKFLNKTIDLFNFHPFNDKIVKEDILLKNNILPITLVKQFQEEVVITTGMNVIEQAKLKAIALAYDKMKKTLKDNEYIISHRVLDSKIIAKGVEMKIFFSICEDITDYQEIKPVKEVE